MKQTVPANTSDSKELLSKLYFNEIIFYEKIWKQLDKFQKSFQNVKQFNRIPKCYASSSEVKSQEKLVLENLKCLQYEMYPRPKSFDDNHMKLLVETYGHYHGLSAAYRELNPEEFMKLSRLLKDSTSSLFQFDIFRILVQMCMMRNYNTFVDETIRKKLKKYIDHLSDIVNDSLKYDGKNPVINHGDCWSNNMLFLNDVSIRDLLLIFRRNSIIYYIVTLTFY